MSVGTNDDLVLAQETGVAALAAMRGVMDDPGPSALTTELGDSWVTLRFFGWVDQSQADFGRVRSEAIRLVKIALERAEVSMPSPEYVVAMRGGELPRVEDAFPRGRPSTRAEESAERPVAEQQDVSVDSTLDEQIAEDRSESGERDLLADGEGSEEQTSETRGGAASASGG